MTLVNRFRSLLSYEVVYEDNAELISNPLLQQVIL